MPDDPDDDERRQQEHDDPDRDLDAEEGQERGAGEDEHGDADERQRVPQRLEQRDRAHAAARSTSGIISVDWVFRSRTPRPAIAVPATTTPG